MGGGAMRAAAKFAGIKVGLRGIPTDNNPLSSAARRAASLRPAAAARDDLKLEVSMPLAGGMQKSCLEVDDWVFADGEEQVMPRVVFGGAPSLQEAKEATSELTVALEKVYLASPKTVDCEGSFVDGHESSLPLSISKVADVKACVTGEMAIAPAVPGCAIQAFRLLHESSMAQNVVASIACDPNVWNAVLQNQELQEFLQSQRACSLGENSNVELVSDSFLLDQSSVKSISDSSEGAEPEPASGFMDVYQNIKNTVVEMMSSLSSYFQYFFGIPEPSRVFANSDGTARLSAETVMEASFMGLAVMAILVILLNRA